MQKSELIAQIATELGISPRVARAVIDQALEDITKVLAAGEKIILSSFGTFSVKTRQARRGINPQTQAPMLIPAISLPAFTPSRRLRQRLGRVIPSESEGADEHGQ